MKLRKSIHQELRKEATALGIPMGLVAAMANQKLLEERDKRH